ncbi:MAG: transcriptional regulator [Lysobacteraceae bacterium]|nr:MAG: transcriptional regulator [Xanthomonadaceae bacterium]
MNDFFDTKATLKQWEALRVVVEEGGYERAAETLGRAQSTVSHTVKALQQGLGVQLLKVQGRKAELTPEGRVLLDQARHLLASAQQLETFAATVAAGHEAEITVVVDVITPERLLLNALCRFAEDFPMTRVEIVESSLSGTDELLARREADVVITPRVPPGFHGSELITINFVAVAHPDHPLHALNRPLSLEDLKPHRQLVVRDSGDHRRRDAGWLGAQQRWTMSTMGMRKDCLLRGLGFSWMPQQKIADELDSGRLKALPMTEGNERRATLFLVLANGKMAGPASAAFSDALQSCAATSNPAN